MVSVYFPKHQYGCIHSPAVCVWTTISNNIRGYLKYIHTWYGGMGKGTPSLFYAVYSTAVSLTSCKGIGDPNFFSVPQQFFRFFNTANGHYLLFMYTAVHRYCCAIPSRPVPLLLSLPRVFLSCVGSIPPRPLNFWYCWAIFFVGFFNVEALSLCVCLVFVWHAVWTRLLGNRSVEVLSYRSIAGSALLPGTRYLSINLDLFYFLLAWTKKAVCLSASGPNLFCLVLFCYTALCDLSGSVTFVGVLFLAVPYSGETW